MSATADIVILGGGCAGLSLAVQLAERGQGLRRVVVLEQRSEYTRDRTWCGWSLDPHPFQSSVDHAWSRWSVQLGGEALVHESARYAYEHLRADRFYADAQQRIARSSVVELRLGVSVERVESRGRGEGASHGSREGHRVVTSDGSLDAPVVVDTRPPASPPGTSPARGGMLQHFLGHEITVADPVFDPKTATLMDFDVPQNGEIHFVYVLPFSPTRALVESTIFSAEVLPRAAYEERIEGYVADRLGTRVEAKHYSEHGVIPMRTMVPENASARRAGLYSAGTPGGAIKPSSGYGFHAIQRTTAALAARLGEGAQSDRRIRARSPLDGWMDEVFLSFLRQHSDRGPEVFFRLFRKLEPDVLVRFLMERPTVGDRLRVIGSMPKLPFAREAVRKALPGRLREAPGVAFR